MILCSVLNYKHITTGETSQSIAPFKRNNFGILDVLVWVPALKHLQTFSNEWSFVDWMTPNQLNGHLRVLYSGGNLEFRTKKSEVLCWTKVLILENVASVLLSNHVLLAERFLDEWPFVSLMFCSMGGGGWWDDDDDLSNLYFNRT